MLKIRLQRVGRAHEPVYRLVLTDSKNGTKSGKSLEILGNYDSRRGESAVFKTERISHWLSKGAQASTTVHNLLISKKIIEGKKINNLPLKKAIVKEKVEEPVAPAPEKSSPVENTEEKAAEKVEENTPVEEVAQQEAPVKEAIPEVSVA